MVGSGRRHRRRGRRHDIVPPRHRAPRARAAQERLA
jgi:hypothetical protein